MRTEPQRNPAFKNDRPLGSFLTRMHDSHVPTGQACTLFRCYLSRRFRICQNYITKSVVRLVLEVFVCETGCNRPCFYQKLAICDRSPFLNRHNFHPSPPTTPHPIPSRWRHGRQLCSGGSGAVAAGDRLASLSGLR